jgi:hypothetical protein
MQDVGLECEPAQRTTTAKRRRAAQVHNLSERVIKAIPTLSLTNPSVTCLAGRAATGHC